MAKLPSTTIKTILKGAKVELLFGKDSFKGNEFLHSGIRGFDDKVHHLNVTGIERFREGQSAILKILENKVRDKAMHRL